MVRERAETGIQPAETVAKAIEIGARVIDSESTATNVDYVQRVFEERVGKLSDELTETLDEGSGEIARHIAERFDVDRADSVQGEIKTMLVAAVQHQQEQLNRMLTAEDGSNPLNAVQMRTAKAMIEAEDRHRKQIKELQDSHSNESRALQGRVAELSERVTQLVEHSAGEELLAEAEAAGTRKGFTFEESVFEAIEEIADARGDCATHTGGEGAEGGGKKGDVVVELARRRRPVQRPDRLRGQGPQAFQERCLDGAQHGDGRSRRLLRGAGRRRRGPRPLRPRAAARVRGQQADRRRRPRRAGLARRLRSPTGSRPPAWRWRAAAT